MEEKEKNNYEVTFWAKEEDASPVTAVLQKNGCDVVEEKPLQKMQLAYPLKKEKYAFLGTIVFTASGEAIRPVMDALNLENAVLRYYVGNTDKRRVMPGAEGKPLSGLSSLKERSNYANSFKKREEEVLTNESLEKKIEEILN